MRELSPVSRSALPAILRQLIPESLEAGGYHLALNHARHTLIVQEPPKESRWVFISDANYSLFLLMLHRFLQQPKGLPDFVSLPEALQVTGLWTGHIEKLDRHKLGKHIYKLRLHLAPYFQIQSLLDHNNVAGFRLLSMHTGSADQELVAATPPNWVDVSIGL